MSPESPRAKSFADILQQNQEFVAHLQTLQDDMGTQLAENAKELELVKRHEIRPANPASERPFRRAITETPRHDAEVVLS